MEGAKMVDKTNMSLDEIIKMDRKNVKGKPSFLKSKNSMARNVVKKAKNSFLNRKPVNSPKKTFAINDNRQDVRSKLIKAKQMKNTKIVPQNIQRTARNSNYQGQNRILNINSKSRINRRNSVNMHNPVPAFRITTNNERYQSNNQQRATMPYERAANKRISTNNNNTNSNNNNFHTFPNRNQNYPIPSSISRRPVTTGDSYYQNPSRNESRSDMRRVPSLTRDREYEAMARALIEAHRESRYSINPPASSQRRYNHPMESRGYLYRR